MRIIQILNLVSVLTCSKCNNSLLNNNNSTETFFSTGPLLLRWSLGLTQLNVKQKKLNVWLRFDMLNDIYEDKGEVVGILKYTPKPLPSSTQPLIDSKLNLCPTRYLSTHNLHLPTLFTIMYEQCTILYIDHF